LIRRQGCVSGQQNLSLSNNISVHIKHLPIYIDIISMLSSKPIPRYNCGKKICNSSEIDLLILIFKFWINHRPKSIKKIKIMDALVNYSSEDDNDEDAGYEIRVNTPYKMKGQNENYRMPIVSAFFFFFFVYTFWPRRACASMYISMRVCLYVCMYVCMQANAYAYVCHMYIISKCTYVLQYVWRDFSQSNKYQNKYTPLFPPHTRYPCLSNTVCSCT